MPRNGDGSGDSGPFDGHEIVHGNSGDATLQHTKHVAPTPKVEEGDALPGMAASGGAAAPLNKASEEYGASAPRNGRFGDDQTSASRKGTLGSGNSSNEASTSSSDKKSSSNGNASHDTHGLHQEPGTHDLEHISREKAERYVNLNEEDVLHAGTRDTSNSGAERSSQRAPRDVGAKEDVEQLHGKSTTGQGDDRGEKSGSDKSGSDENGKKGVGQGGSGPDGHELESNMRHKAEKFVSLEE